jgi:magnesium-transporting ATPase (P-type)
MIDTYLYSVFFTLFVGFFKESDVFLIMDLFAYQNCHIITYISIVIVVLFAKQNPNNFNLADLKNFSQNKGLAQVLKEAKDLSFKLEDLVKFWESEVMEEEGFGTKAESDSSFR